jgi:hypothetical protein
MMICACPLRWMRSRSRRKSNWRLGESRRFGLVEQEDARAAATLLEEAQKALPMRIGQEIRAASHFLQIARDLEKAFGPEEPTLADLGQPAGAQRLGDGGAAAFPRTAVVHCAVAGAAAGLVEAGQYCNRLQQRRLADAIFAGDHRHRRIEA